MDVFYQQWSTPTVNRFFHSKQYSYLNSETRLYIVSFACTPSRTRRLCRLSTPKYTSPSGESRAPKLNRGCFICKARLWKTLLQLSKIRERNGGLVVAYCILTRFNFTGTWAFTVPIYNSLVCVIPVMARFKGLSERPGAELFKVPFREF